MRIRDWSSDVCSSDLFGNLELEDDQVVEFTEKVQKQETWINGGFFVFEPGVLDYLPGDSEPLEHSPLINLARDGELFAYKHNGFWHPDRKSTRLNSSH